MEDFEKYHCTYCQEDISGLRIKCAECTDFDLCLQCFSAGAEIGPHKNDHAYQFMVRYFNKNDHAYQFRDARAIEVCFGKGGWSANEEIHLLHAIEQYGFGNWEDISAFIETRSPEEAKEEYIARYMEGSIGRLTWPTAAQSRPNLEDDTPSDNGPLSPRVTSQLPPLDITREEAASLGYMPQRDDFEREYDNSAESLLSPLFINNLEDDDLDVALKLAHVDMYTRRLRERARRKRVVRDFQLVSMYFAQTRKDRGSKKKLSSKEEKEFNDRLRVMSQFHTAQEHEQFLQNLKKARELRIRISELIRYRRNGLTRHEECAHFEQELLDHEEWRERRSGSSGSILSSPSMGQKKKERSDAVLSSTDAKCTFKSNKAPNLNSSGEGVEAAGEPNPPTDISTLQGYHLLSAHEIKLCSSLNLKPSQYMTLKMVLLRDYVNKGPKKEDVVLTPTAGPEKYILHYLVSSGWITAS
ncbi:hypothetical protein R5R35_006799 [Gryllus longicercus]|uniref:Transcriptional adapter n=1 Tax=Gryllus longicercus TaxID=2509291 RepID=A0AAN9V4J8_9ORTH